VVALDLLQHLGHPDVEVHAHVGRSYHPHVPVAQGRYPRRIEFKKGAAEHLQPDVDVEGVLPAAAEHQRNHEALGQVVQQQSDENYLLFAGVRLYLQRQVLG
jgi:hypothetical protein